MNTFRMVQLCLATLSIALLSCQRETNVAEVRKEIEEADARQLNAFATKDLAGLTANYAADAVILPQNGPMVTGREGRDAFFKEMSNMVSDFKFSMSKFEASGDLAYEIGTYSGMMQMPGMGTIADTGKFLTVWKRQADGKWMIVADIFNTNLAPPMPVMDQKKKK
jgi:ketosteroid isomerase-like protein